MTRRTLLAALAAPAPKTWPFGYSFKGFPKWPLDKSFALCHQLGYTGVELFAPSPSDAAEAGKLSLKHRLPVLTIMEDLRLTGEESPHTERLELSLQLAGKLGKPVIETVVGGKPAEWDQLRSQFLVHLRTWARLAEKYKVTVAIKAHIGSALHLPGDAAGLCCELGSPFIKINYDYSHFQLQGLPLEDSLKAALPYIAMIHIKDSNGAAPNHRFALPGQGHINYTEYASLLRRLNYRGPIIVEVSAHVLQQADFNAESAARFVAQNVLPKFA